MARKISISGIVSLFSFLVPFFGAFESLSTSISVLAWRPKGTSPLLITLRSCLATAADALVGGKVSAITCERTSGVRRLRRDEMDRKARNVNRESNSVTARSRRAKLLLISIERSMN